MTKITAAYMLVSETKKHNRKVYTYNDTWVYYTVQIAMYCTKLQK